MNRDKLKDIYNKYNLAKEDIFILKFGSTEKPIITRSGIEKIQNQLKIQIQYKLEKVSDDHKSCIILATGVVFGDGIAQQGLPPKPKHMRASFGECNPENNKSNYPISIAEKRAKARVVLQISGLYMNGIMSEDESEDFKKLD